MKRLILILLTVVLAAGVFSGCDLHRAKEGQIVFSLEETQGSACTWNYYVDPQGALDKVRDEIYEKDGVLLHEWIFEGVEEGEVGITFQYSEEGEDPIRTVHYSCFVDENLHVGLTDTEDSAEKIGTSSDERLVECISTAISLQFGQEMNYPSKKVSQEYALEFLNCYANLFYGETDAEDEIALETETMQEILHVAFGNRIGMEDLNLNLHDGLCYFEVQNYAWVDAIPMEEELQYVFTVMGETESIDGTATVTVSETEENDVGLTLTSVAAQKNE